MIEEYRILAGIRQSKHRKGHTPDISPEIQREILHTWAASKSTSKRRYVIIDEAIDLNVSGRKIAAWNRPRLREWLVERADEFDAIAFAYMDRAGRDTEAFLNFQSQYLRPLGKKLHFANPDVDLSTPEGQMVATNLMGVAQFFSDLLSRNMRGVTKKIRHKGEYPGGPVPFGLCIIKLDNGLTSGWGYGVDHDLNHPNAWIVAQMARRYLLGASMRQVCNWLNDCGIPSPRGKDRWGTESVRLVLRSPGIAGIQSHLVVKPGRKQGEAEPLLDEETGEYVTICDGIIAVAGWQKIRDLMDENGHSGPRSNSGHLLHVAYCGHSGDKLYSCPQTQRGKTYDYLKCARKVKPELPGECVNPVIRAELVMDAVSYAIMDEKHGLRDLRYKTKKVTPRNDRRDELESIETQLANLATALVMGKISPELAGKAESGLTARREKILELVRPEKTEYVDTGKTFGQHWMSLDDAGRHAFMVASKIRAVVELQGTGTKADPMSFVRPKEGHGRISVAAGRHVIHVDLGELEALRRKAVAS